MFGQVKAGMCGPPRVRSVNIALKEINKQERLTPHSSTSSAFTSSNDYSDRVPCRLDQQVALPTQGYRRSMPYRGDSNIPATTRYSKIGYAGAVVGVATTFLRQ